MEYPLGETLSNMDWLNPLDYWDLIMSFFEIFCKFQGKLLNHFVHFYGEVIDFGMKTLPHHHPILMSPIIFIYLIICITILCILGIILGITLCIANLFPTWILLMLVYIIFWRDPKMIEFKNIVLCSAVFLILDLFNLW